MAGGGWRRGRCGAGRWRCCGGRGRGGCRWRGYLLTELISTVIAAQRVGAENSSTSCDLGIFVDAPAQAIDPHVPCWSGRWDGRERCRLPERTVGPMLVVVRQIARQHRLQLPSAHDQHPVEQLTTDGADPPFRVRVRPRRQHGCAQDADVFGAEDRIEAVGEPRVPVPDEEPELPDALPKVHEVGEPRVPVPDEEPELPDALPKVMRRFRACCVTHAPVVLAVTPRMWTRRLATSITNSKYRRLSSTVSTWKKSHASRLWACVARNCCQVRSARRGAGSTPARLSSSHTVLGATL